MGTKLLWTGITLLLAIPALLTPHIVLVIGAILMLTGLALLWLDK